MAELPVVFKPGFVYRKLLWGFGLGYAYSTYKNIAFNGGARAKHAEDKQNFTNISTRCASLEREVAELNQLKALYAPKQEAKVDGESAWAYTDLEKPDWLDTMVLTLDKPDNEDRWNNMGVETIVDQAEGRQ